MYVHRRKCYEIRKNNLYFSQDKEIGGIAETESKQDYRRET